MESTRRQFVQQAAGAGLLTAGLSRAFAQPAPPPTIYVRRDVYSLAPDGPEIIALRQAIAAMKARPVSDPTSWLFQANIHGTTDSTPPAFRDVWSTCQHGSFFFLSWHRMYLYYFERILRAASGSADFALPYWNYAVPAQRRLPVAFRSPAAASNPLFVSQRRSSINSGQQLPTSATGATQALGTIAFSSPAGSGSSFGGPRRNTPIHQGNVHGRLESQPHDVIHVQVGGAAGWMTDPDRAARDPIFWLHHCNIDRLWNRWLALGGGRDNPVSNTAWMNTKFTFYDADGQKVMLSGADVRDSVTQLQYRYDDDPSPPPPPPPPVVVGGPTPDTEAAAPSRVIAALPATEAGLRLEPRDATVVLQPASPGATESATAPGSGPLTLSFDQIAYRRPVGIYYEVYLNQPQGASPDPHSPYYAGNLAFFALGHVHGEGVTGATVQLDVTGVLARQRQLGLWSGGPVRIDLHPSDTEDATEAGQVGPLVTIGQVRLLAQ
jgi:tyrosinase